MTPSEETRPPSGDEEAAEGRQRAARHKSGPRRRGREMALQMLFQREQAATALDQVLRDFDLELFRNETAETADPAGDRQAFRFARTLVEGVEEHRDEIDQRIRDRAENWRLERMAAVDRNILRVAVSEFLLEPDVPKVVVLDEAIELAKKFGSEQSSGFINGLLDALLRGERFAGRMT